MPVFVSQYSVMLSRMSSRVSSPVVVSVRSRAATTAAAGWPSASLWSRSQAARPIGESAIPYKRLRTRRHHLRVLDLLVRSEQLRVGAPLLGREPGRRRLASQRRRVHVCRNDARHVGVDGEQTLGVLQPHLIHDERTPIATLGDIAAVTEASHQARPGSAHAFRPPAGAGRLSRESVAGHRWNHQVECVGRAPSVRRRIGQRLDEFQLLEDRAGPPVTDQERQCVVVRRPDVDEVDVEPVDLGDELRQGVQPPLAAAPVVVGAPVAR